MPTKKVIRNKFLRRVGWQESPRPRFRRVKSATHAPASPNLSACEHDTVTENWSWVFHRETCDFWTVSWAPGPAPRFRGLPKKTLDRAHVKFWEQVEHGTFPIRFTWWNCWAPVPPRTTTNLPVSIATSSTRVSFWHCPRTICPSVSLRASTRVSPDFVPFSGMVHHLPVVQTQRNTDTHHTHRQAHTKQKTFCSRRWSWPSFHRGGSSDPALRWLWLVGWLVGWLCWLCVEALASRCPPPKKKCNQKMERKRKQQKKTGKWRKKRKQKIRVKMKRNANKKIKWIETQEKT